MVVFTGVGGNQGSFLVWAQPMRDNITKTTLQCLPIPIIIPANAFKTVGNHASDSNVDIPKSNIAMYTMEQSLNNRFYESLLSTTSLAIKTFNT